jgi:branched-chain amino acid transport system permease protein
MSTLAFKGFKPWYGLFIAVILFAIAPSFMPLSIVSDILVFFIVVLGFDLLFGHTGFLSFGHSAFFGLGTYGTAIFLKYAMLGKIPIPPTWYWLALVIGVIVATGAGVLGGYLALRRPGVYGTFITVAFQQAMWWLMLKWYWVTGGENGLVNLPYLTFKLPGLPQISLADPYSAYFFNLLIAIPIICLVYRLIHSPYGLILRAIKDNEERVRFLGYNVHKYKLSSFTLSAFLGGVGGALYVNYYQFTALHTIDWLASGDIVIMAVLGGSGVFWGPLIGSALYIIIKDFLTFYTWWWRIFVGSLAILVILFFRKGVWGILTSVSRKLVGNQS